MMSHTKSIAFVLWLVCASGLALLAQTTPPTPPSPTPQPQIGTIIPMGPDKCDVVPPSLKPSKTRGDVVYWVLPLGAGKNEVYEVRFDKDGNPCDGNGSFKATGHGPSEYCYIAKGANIGQSYHYHVYKQDGTTACVDPSVDVQNGRTMKHPSKKKAAPKKSDTDQKKAPPTDKKP